MSVSWTIRCLLQRSWISRIVHCEFHAASALFVMDSTRTAFDTEAKKRQQGEASNKSIIRAGLIFNEVPPDLRSKEAFHNAIGLFLQRNIHRRGQVEFIYAALRKMKEFGVHKDLESYKRLLEVFPKGKMVPTNVYQTEYMHYPRHQTCCIDVLDQMTYYAVYPDKEIYDIVRNTFGEWTYAMRKMKRMMYWMPKFKHINPYPIPRPLPTTAQELAMVAVRRMCRDPATQLSVWHTQELPDCTEKTWIVSGQSVEQSEHIVKHKASDVLYVDGPFLVYVGDQQLKYFSLLAEPSSAKAFGDFYEVKEITEESLTNWSTKYNAEYPDSRKEIIAAPTLHEQPEGTILALCITGSASKDSLVHWIRFLERGNPVLTKLSVVFRLASAATSEVMVRDPSLDFIPRQPSQLPG